MKRSILIACLVLVSSCAILPGGKPRVRSNVYLLESHIDVAEAPGGCEVVVVNPAIAAPGQLGAQMLYQRRPNEIERFAYSRWVASPAAMIDPLLLDVLRLSQRFDAVLPAPAAIRADLRIENDDLWLIQRFSAERSFIELRMSSRIYSPGQRRLVASKNFSYDEPAVEATPVAGVAAADRAVQRLLADYYEFVKSAADTFEQVCVNSD